jgi:hypothetical protein
MLQEGFCNGLYTSRQVKHKGKGHYQNVEPHEVHESKGRPQGPISAMPWPLCFTLVWQALNRCNKLNVEVRLCCKKKMGH